MLALVAAPSTPEGIELREVDEATPLSGEARVEVNAVSVNRGELNRLMTAEDGWRPGWDVAGIVLQQAADGSGPATGERVVGLSKFGSWSERLCIEARQLAVIPDAVSFAQAATLPVAGLAALRMLRLGGLLLDRRVLVTGAAGGVGRFAVQLGRRAGARVTAVVGSEERGHGLRELGADQVVVSSDHLAGYYDLILESVGGASLTASLKLIGDNGTLVVYGNSSRDATNFLIQDFYLRMPLMTGFFLLNDMVRDPVANDLGLLLGLVAAGALDPQISLETSWREAAGALRALRERRLPGKAVLHLR
jgi:NADPH:quinone reductase